MKKNLLVIAVFAAFGVGAADKDPNLAKNSDRTKTEAGTKEPTSKPSTASKMTDSTVKLNDYTRATTGPVKQGKDNKP